jgi:hypothetical protein
MRAVFEKGVVLKTGTQQHQCKALAAAVLRVISLREATIDYDPVSFRP